MDGEPGDEPGGTLAGVWTGMPAGGAGVPIVVFAEAPTVSGTVKVLSVGPPDPRVSGERIRQTS